MLQSRKVQKLLLLHNSCSHSLMINLINSTQLLLTLSIPMEAVRVILVLHTLLLHFALVFVK